MKVMGSNTGYLLKSSLCSVIESKGSNIDHLGKEVVVYLLFESYFDFTYYPRYIVVGTCPLSRGEDFAINNFFDCSIKK